MRAVKTEDLTALSQAPPAPPKAKKAPKPQGDKPNPRTFSLYPRHDEIVNAVAMGLSKAKGKPASASEAMRYILEKVDSVVDAENITDGVTT